MSLPDGSKYVWRIRVSIPVPRRCKRRTLPIELIPLILVGRKQQNSSTPARDRTGDLLRVRQSS